MFSRSQATAGICVAPAVALGIGVWAEFAHLTPPVLFAASLPAITIATVCAALLARRAPWPVALLLAGALVGTITFGLAEGTHVALHLALGRSLNFDAYHSEAAKAFALTGIHLAAGALVGVGVGAGLALLSIAGRRVLGRRGDPHPRPPADPSPASGRGV